MRSLVVVWLLVATVTAYAQDMAWHANLADAAAAARASGKPILAVFAGAGCGPCEELQTVTFAAPEVVEAAQAFEAVVIDGFTERAVATHFLVSTYPTVKFLDADGTVVYDCTGFIPPDEFLKVLKRGLAAHQALVRARAAAAEAGETPSADAALAIARDFAFSWQYAKAAQWAQRALDAAPEQAVGTRAEALLIRGRALIEVGEPRLAVQALNEHLRLAPEGPQVWTARLALGNAWLQAGETETGVAVLLAVYRAPEAGDDLRAEARRLLFWAGVDVE